MPEPAGKRLQRRAHVARRRDSLEIGLLRPIEAQRQALERDFDLAGHRLDHFQRQPRREPRKPLREVERCAGGRRRESRGIGQLDLRVSVVKAEAPTWPLALSTRIPCGSETPCARCTTTAQEAAWLERAARLRDVDLGLPVPGEDCLRGEPDLSLAVQRIEPPAPCDARWRGHARSSALTCTVACAGAPSARTSLPCAAASETTRE